MKKIVTFLLATVMCITFVGCNNQESIQAAEPEKTYSFNGEEYKESELSEQTIAWLEADETERMLSSWYPPEFAENRD